MEKIWNENYGFGEVVGTHLVAGERYLLVCWDASPWFIDEILESQVQEG